MSMRAHNFSVETPDMHLNSLTTSAAWAVLTCSMPILAASQAAAADLASASTMAYPTYEPQSAVHRRFYVRGDIGIGQHDSGAVSQAELAKNRGSFISQSIGDAETLGAGIGVQINHRFRLDVTGEYRSSAEIKAMDNLRGTLAAPAGTLQANTLYQGELSAYVGLLNAYYDVFNWRGFTPYIGGGIGAAHLRMRDVTTTSSATFTGVNPADSQVQLTAGTARPNSETNFAWALMAGTSYDLSSNAKLDIGYRYLNMGSGIAVATGLIDCRCGTTGSPLKLSDLEAHEVRIGVRWMLGAGPSYAEPASMK
jgi:opacity protein-like surface antigen